MCMQARDTHMGLTKAQLQQKARILGCPASGTKAQLVDRMIQVRSEHASGVVMQAEGQGKFTDVCAHCAACDCTTIAPG